MPKRNEFPYPNTEQSYWSGGAEHTMGPLPERATSEPATALQALMEAAVGTEPVISLEERRPLWEAVEHAISRLTLVEREMIETFFYREEGYRGIEKETGIAKTTAHRLMPAVIERLKRFLLEEPLVQQRLGIEMGVNIEEDSGGASADSGDAGGTSES